MSLLTYHQHDIELLLKKLKIELLLKKSTGLLQNLTRDQEHDTQSLRWLMNNKKYITKILTRSSLLSIVPTKHRLVILND